MLNAYTLNEAMVNGMGGAGALILPMPSRGGACGPLPFAKIHSTDTVECLTQRNYDGEHWVGAATTGLDSRQSLTELLGQYMPELIDGIDHPDLWTYRFPAFPGGTFELGALSWPFTCIVYSAATGAVSATWTADQGELVVGALVNGEYIFRILLDDTYEHRVRVLVGPHLYAGIEGPFHALYTFDGTALTGRGPDMLASRVDAMLEVDGVLWLGGQRCGPTGRYPFLWSYDGVTFTPRIASMGGTASSGLADREGHTISRLCQWRGNLYGLQTPQPEALARHAGPSALVECRDEGFFPVPGLDDVGSGLWGVEDGVAAAADGVYVTSATAGGGVVRWDGAEVRRISTGVSGAILDLASFHGSLWVYARDTYWQYDYLYRSDGASLREVVRWPRSGYLPGAGLAASGMAQYWGDRHWLIAHNACLYVIAVGSEVATSNRRLVRYRCCNGQRIWPERELYLAPEAPPGADPTIWMAPASWSRPAWLERRPVSSNGILLAILSTSTLGVIADGGPNPTQRLNSRLYGAYAPGTVWADDFFVEWSDGSEAHEPEADDFRVEWRFRADNSPHADDFFVEFSDGSGAHEPWADDFFTEFSDGSGTNEPEAHDFFVDWEAEGGDPYAGGDAVVADDFCARYAMTIAGLDPGDTIWFGVHDDDDEPCAAVRVVLEGNQADAGAMRAMVRADKETLAVTDWDSYQEIHIGPTTLLREPGNFVRVALIRPSTVSDQIGIDVRFLRADGSEAS